MTKIQKTITSLIIVSLLFICGYFLVNRGMNKPVFGDTTNYNPLSSGTVTNTSVACNTTQTLLLATSSAGRPFVSISNNSAYTENLGLGNSAVANSGIMIPASTTITLNQNSIYLGQIMCIATGGIATTTMSYVN